MSYTLHATGILACLAICAVAGAQTAPVTVPPSKDAPEQWQGIVNTPEFQAVQSVTDYKAIQDVTLRSVTHLAKDPAAGEVLEKAAKPFAIVGDALAVYDVGETYARGETGEAANKAVRFAIDKGVEIGCAASGFPLPCEATYTAVTMVGDAANEKWKINDKINKYAYEPIYDAYQSFAHPELDPDKPEFWDLAKQKHQDAMAARRQQAHDRFQRTSSANEAEQLRINSEFAARSAPPPSAADNTNDDAFADFLGTLTDSYLQQQQLQQQQLQQQQLQSVPEPTAPATAPASSSGGCHPGHDEERHPGGCHRDPQ